MPTQPRDELLCPKCQAPLPEIAARATCVCRFCGVVSMPSAPKVIERVVERIVERVVVLSPSGAPLAAAAMTCPRCVQPLFEGAADDIVLHGCGACGGIWLDNAASTRIADGVSSPEVKALADRAARRALPANPDTRPAGIPCPVCRAPLARVRAPRGAIALDVCAAHGTWFDRYELTGLMYAVHPPEPVRTGLPTEEELLRAAAMPTTAAERAAFDVSVASSANALEQTATRTALGVTLGLLGAALVVAAGDSRS